MSRYNFILHLNGQTRKAVISMNSFVIQVTYYLER